MIGVTVASVALLCIEVRVLGEAGDCDGNGLLNTRDLACWLPCLGGPTGAVCSAVCNEADLDGDGDVDLRDFATFQRHCQGYSSCVSDSECHNSLFCTGPEVCGAGGYCLPGKAPCAEQFCYERDDSCRDCTGASIEYLRATMDRYHGERLWVYDDTDSAGNHFLVWSSFTKAGTARNCPIVIHGDTLDGVCAGSASCRGSPGLAERAVFRRYDAPAGGPATISLCGSSFDTVLSVGNCCPCVAGADVGTCQCELACNDDACGDQSQIALDVGAGKSYLIRVAGKGNNAGPFTLTILGPENPNAPPTLNCDVSVEFDALTTKIHDGEAIAPIHAGATAIQFRLNYMYRDDFGGLVMNNGVFGPIAEGGALRPNYGSDCGACENLSGATVLKFWARGEKGGERVKFFLGGVGWDGARPVTTCPDSTRAVEHEVVLSSQWTEYTIPLGGLDISCLIGGFGWAANAEGDPDFGKPASDNALMFYVDSIYFELDEATACRRRWREPRFLQSFTTRPSEETCDPVVGDFDHRFRGVAYVYDNALALLAFLAEGSADSLDRARLIGDAFAYAAQHDRKLRNGELRSAYAAGDLALPPGWKPNGIEGEVRLAGFFNPTCQEYQSLFADNISVGNTAWAMLALLTLYQRTNETKYLDEAQRLGEFIRQFRNHCCGGFTGGLANIDSPMPRRETFISGEHNIDVYAAFQLMHVLTGDSAWSEGAQHARDLVWSLWDERVGCFRAGTDLACRVNETPCQLPLDVQPWAVLGIPGTLEKFPRVLECAACQHLTECRGFEGFDFNECRDGVWFEGTAHMALAYSVEGQDWRAAAFRNELCRAQLELPSWRGELPSPFAGPSGVVAACRDGVETGFGFLLYERLHVGATAWNVFAQLGRNPYRLLVD